MVPRPHCNAEVGTWIGFRNEEAVGFLSCILRQGWSTVDLVHNFRVRNPWLLFTSPPLSHGFKNIRMFSYTSLSWNSALWLPLLGILDMYHRLCMAQHNKGWSDNFSDRSTFLSKSLSSFFPLTLSKVCSKSFQSATKQIWFYFKTEQLTNEEHFNGKLLKKRYFYVPGD